jgi:hypothetical protein
MKLVVRIDHHTPDFSQDSCGRAVLGRAVLGRAVLGRAVLGRAPNDWPLGTHVLDEHRREEHALCRVLERRIHISHQ